VKKWRVVSDEWRAGNEEKRDGNTEGTEEEKSRKERIKITQRSAEKRNPGA
jgi:hypothetical protein